MFPFDDVIMVDFPDGSKDRPSWMQLMSHPKIPLVSEPDPDLGFNSLKPSDAYMCRQIRLILIQIMACRLFGDEPLSEPILSYYDWDPGDIFQWNLIKIRLSVMKNKFENIFWNWHLFCLGVRVLKASRACNLNPSIAPSAASATRMFEQILTDLNSPVSQRFFP